MNLKQTGWVEMETRTSCITDMPLQSIDNDALYTSKYAKALFNFIVGAETPVTIGIQGDWGSGKTSLITCLQHLLENDEKHRSLCVLVNAWEHSLFQPKDSKAEVTLSLLGGMAGGLGRIINTAKDENSTEYKWLDVPKEDKLSQLVQSTLNGMWGLVKFGVKVGINYASGGTANIATQNSGKQDKSDNSESQVCPPMAQNVHALKSNLEEQVKSLKCKGSNEQVRIVFFIDDLDRVPPSVAVEILDVTKNIFSISNCIFVLAVDYEVIVKGLESKFGKKTEENEREFRQYFDKIIQIPFSMPIGVYASNMGRLLENSLARLNYGNLSDDIKKRIVDAANVATGGIPRAIKRIINTLSLLKYISNMSSDVAEEGNDTTNKKSTSSISIDIQFIVVALHINYPEIFKRLMQDMDFTQWKIKNYNEQWALNYDEYKDKIPNNEYFDDEWEKVVYCLCAKDTWLKKNAKNISKLLNLLVTSLGASPNKPFDDSCHDKLDTVLQDIRIVSIDTDEPGYETVNERTNAYNSVSIFGRKLHQQLCEKLPNIENVGDPNDFYARIEDGLRKYTIHFVDSKKFLEFQSGYDEQYFCLFYPKATKLKVNEIKTKLLKLASGFEVESTSVHYGIYKTFEVSRKDFTQKSDFSEFYELYKRFDSILDEFNKTF